MNTQYVLRTNTFDCSEEIVLSEIEYLECKESKIKLSEMFSIEEKYHIIINNYSDFEKSVLNISLLNEINRGGYYQEFYEFKSELNTKIINILTSTRLYIDSLETHVSEIFNDKKIKELVKSYKYQEYDEKIHYRFMEAFRNYLQHSGMAVHRLSLAGRWKEDKSKREMYIDIYAQKDLLDAKFKASVLDEITNEIDLKEYIRNYIDSIGVIHSKIRDLVSSTIDNARNNLELMHTRYQEQYKVNTVSLSIIQLENNKNVETIPILLEWDDIRKNLQKRYYVPTHHSNVSIIS
ncbi:hypothetical protein [Sulfuricurvum sp.]|uniref:hypothetical protein n=1 Tax=Sulfuricurvum sp. TaxID=2025608 RepID=UPI002D3FEA99|nr:hypothetical protein [Sulfuricurvum sp.]HZF71171.1 hypothetical protein [Sulfuricurvum sp.]